jgi:hypothetical protein
MWFLSKRNARLAHRVVIEAEAKPHSSAPTQTRRSGRRGPLVLEVLEDRLAPATLVQTLYPPDDVTSQTAGLFGSATVTNSDFHIVSMPRANIGGVEHRGAAYVYRATTGALIATLINPSPTYDGFGGLTAMSLSGNTVVVGAHYFDDPEAVDVGRAYVFDAPTGALITTLVNPSPASFDRFGWRVSISGNSIVVGTDARATGSGRAYVFNATTGALIATLASPSPANGDLFGSSVSISGNTAVVGAYGDDAEATNSGRAYVFNATTGNLIATLANPAPADSDSFGYAVSISGNTAVVGALNADLGGFQDCGAAYVYDATTGALIATLHNPAPASDDGLGAWVAVSGNTAVIGLYGLYVSDAAYVFDATTGALIATLVNPSPKPGDYFGRVSVSGTTVVVGANQLNNDDQGAAYVFSLVPVAVSQPIITSVSPSSGPMAGGTTVVISGAHFQSVTGVAGVKFGPNNASSYTVDSDTKITAVAPAGSGLVNVTVTNSAFTSATAGTANDFRYIGPTDPFQSTISVGPATILVGSTSTITLTARDAAGSQESYGGLTVAFGLGAGSGSGTFSAVTDNQNGTYTATFTGTAAGPITITGTINGQPITSTLPTIDVINQTTTVLTATPNASTGGQLVTFRATIAPSPGNLGKVIFRDNGVLLAANVPVVGGVATLQIASLTEGTHPIRATFGGASGYSASASNILNFVVAAPGTPLVLSVTPNGNLASLAGDQRSRVASLVVAFDQAVQLDPGAMTLALHTSNVRLGGVLQPDGYGSLPTSLNLSTTDNTTWTVTFTGNTDIGADGFDSLKDGVYDLNIDAAKVHPLGVPGVSMAANQTTTFHRLFGDTNAAATPAGGTPGTDFEAIVNTGDNLAFRNAFNKPAGGGYQAFLDFNGDGVINSGDNLQFRNRFNKSLTWRV